MGRLCLVFTLLPLTACSALYDFPLKQTVDSGTDTAMGDTVTDEVDDPSMDTVEDSVPDTMMDIPTEPSPLTGSPCAVNGDGERASEADGYSWNPTTAWSGSQYIVAWSEEENCTYEAYAVLFNASGFRIGSPSAISGHCSGNTHPMAVWTGSEYGVLWGSSNGIRFQRLLPDTTPIDATVEVSDGSDGIRPSFVWTGSEYAAFWQTSLIADNDIRYARITPEGSVTQEGYVHQSTARILDPVAVFTGSEFGLAWVEGPGPGYALFFMTVSATMTGGGTPSPRSGYVAKSPSATWTGSEYALAWTDTSDFPTDAWEEIYVWRLDAAGNPIGLQTRVTYNEVYTRNPKIVWTGEFYGLSFVEYSAECNGLCFTRLDATLETVEDPTDVAPAEWNNSSMVWSGSNFGIAVTDNGDRVSSPGLEVFFNLVDICSD